MQYLFEKDGKMKDKYISGSNIIPYCQDDFKRMMKDIGEDDVEWNNNVSSAICQIAYNFMQELTTRSTSESDKLQNPYDAFDLIKRNIYIKFPQLANQAEALSSEFIPKWISEDEKKWKKSLEKQKQGHIIELDKSKSNKKKGKNKQTKDKPKPKATQYKSVESKINVLDEQEIQKLLDNLSDEELSES